MSQQLYLFPQAPTLIPTFEQAHASSDVLLEETRELFQHHGSNAELMSQIMEAIKVLHEICEHPKE